MTKLISLQCPTCGANLQVDENANKCSCTHCGNSYLLEQKARDLDTAQRENILPMTTYTNQLRQWLRVGNHEIFVHELRDEIFENERFISVNVEYRNNSNETLSCRRNQWVLSDAESYTYDTVAYGDIYEKQGRPPIGGERFVNPGGHVRGWVAFQFPKNAGVKQLQFLTGFLSTKTAEFLLQ